MYKEYQFLTETISVGVTLSRKEVAINWICVGNLL
jgi:hypothetical protein